MEQFNGFEVGGRELRVNEAEERPPRSSEGGGGAGAGAGAGAGGNSRPGFHGRGGSTGGGGAGGAGAGFRKPNKPKGSRRGLRGRKRSL
ncbi:MAG: hypothetical protein JRH20_00315 [Deltaproteobacteria bacterium]|nr:hypothetical protein [Deltaproteobacteria bacterium]